MKGIIGKAGLVLGGIGLGILLVGKLYEKIRKDYNQLVDQHNNLVDFVDNHDFYKKECQKVSHSSDGVYRVDFRAFAKK